MPEETVAQTTPLTKETQTEATITATVSSTPTKIVLVPNWKKVLKTYSFWIGIASVLLTLLEQVLPFVGLLEPTMSAATYGITMFVLNVSAVVFRMIKQKKLWLPDEEKPNV